MKNAFLVWMTIMHVLLISTNKLIAQKTAIKLSASNYWGYAGNAAAKITGENINRLNSSIKPRAMRHFIHTFKDVEAVDWFQTEKVIIANFTENNIDTRVVYNKNGNCLFSVLHYMENNLPEDIRNMVKRSYLNYNIVSVKELHRQDIITYYVHMEDSKSVKIISVCKNDMNVWIAFNKIL